MASLGVSDTALPHVDSRRVRIAAFNAFQRTPVTVVIIAGSYYRSSPSLGYTRELCVIDLDYSC